jgi:hypothetical protein
MDSFPSGFEMRTQIRLHLHGLFLTCALQLLGCGSSSVPVATGKLQIEYLKASSKAVSFRLTNGTGRTVALRGSWTITFGIRIWPGDSHIECESDATGKSESEPLMFAHGRSGQIDVSPGESVTLVVPSELPGRYSDGNCRLRLILRDGTFVGPILFSP